MEGGGEKKRWRPPEESSRVDQKPAEVRVFPANYCKSGKGGGRPRTDWGGACTKEALGRGGGAEEPGTGIICQSGRETKGVCVRESRGSDVKTTPHGARIVRALAGAIQYKNKGLITDKLYNTHHPQEPPLREYHPFTARFKTCSCNPLRLRLPL